MPIPVGVLLLLGAVNSVIPKDSFSRVFSGRLFLDPFIGAFFGAVAAGNPLTSDVIGGEFLAGGISLDSGASVIRKVVQKIGGAYLFSGGVLHQKYCLYLRAR
jgi:hypothetical protein